MTLLRAKLDTMQWEKQKGFTIVELLIVVVVIAILAAITIVSYNGIQARATEASIQSDLRNAMNKFQAYKAINNIFPANDDASLGLAEVKVNKSLYLDSTGNFLYCGNDSSTRQDVAIIAVGKNGKTYAIATNRAFGVYTTYTIASYQDACTDLVSTTSARYGYTGSTWRSWVN